MLCIRILCRVFAYSGYLWSYSKYTCRSFANICTSTRLVHLGTIIRSQFWSSTPNSHDHLDLWLETRMVWLERGRSCISSTQTPCKCSTSGQPPLRCLTSPWWRQDGIHATGLCLHRYQTAILKTGTPTYYLRHYEAAVAATAPASARGHEAAAIRTTFPLEPRRKLVAAQSVKVLQTASLGRVMKFVRTNLADGMVPGQNTSFAFASRLVSKQYQNARLAVFSNSMCIRLSLMLSVITSGPLAASEGLT
jgi:hypothetical protein